MNKDEAWKLAQQVPLVEQLESVPADARLVIDGADGMCTRYIPVGRMCHDAAKALAAPVQEPVGWMNPHGGFLSASYIDNFASGLDKEIHNIPVYTTPPAAPVQDDPDEQVIRERDEAEAIADSLAEKIAAITGCEIGEHTSASSPWHSALDAADEFLASRPPAAQPAVPLTDEQIDKAWRSVDYTVTYAQFRIDIARAIEAAHGIKENT